MSRGRVTQVSYHYLPIVGGQEVYVRQMVDLIKGMGLSSNVIQRSRRGAVPTEEIQCTPHIPLLGRVIGDWDRHVFNLFLLMIRRKSLPTESLVIVHYALHSLFVWGKKERVIVLSHGIDWDDARCSLEHKVREFVARHAFNRFTLVANDTDYLRRFGVSIGPGEHPFEEVAPQKWYIPNCVDTNEFCPISPNSDTESPESILVPRQITPDRGIELAINAFAIFVRTNPSVRLHIAGKTRSQTYLDSCRKLIRKLGLSDKVHFLGFVERGSMPNLYRSATMCLIPSLRREGTSLSALESMGCGTPTVCTRVGGLVDLPAVLALPDPADIADKLCMVYQKRNEFAARQAQCVKTTFNLDNWRFAWQKVIRSKMPSLNIPE